MENMNYLDYKNKTILKQEKSMDEFRGHAVTFIAVNAGLFFLNMITSSGYPWFLFVLGGWGIGMASHWGDRFTATKNVQDLEAINDLSEDELKDLISTQKTRTAFYLHLISNLAVCIYLFMINILTSPGFLWSLIPSIAMGVGVASHWAQFSNKMNKSKVVISNDFIKKPQVYSNPQLDRAEKIRESIIDIIMDIRKKFKHFATDMLPKIDDYVDTIAHLTEKEEDLEKSLKEISEDEILKEKNELILKRENADSILLKNEYDNFLEEINIHLGTIKKLREQKELLNIKITTSINSLKQLNLELVGMKSKTTFEDSSILDDFDKKSSELSIYYKDLLESYDELHK